MAALGPFEPNAEIAVAVSGGSDSMALLHLARQWGQESGARLTVLTVDHGLRTESTAEARQVGVWARALGLDHHVLVWVGPHPSAGMQEAARQARYALLADWCRTHGVLHLLVAHQRDDQAETVMIRLLDGSGIDGLAGMAAATVRHGIRIVRPLLDMPRSRLQATLRQAGVAWFDDPSNDDTAYARTEARRFLKADPADEAAGDWTGLLVRMARTMGRLRTVRARALDRWLSGCVVVHDSGYAAIPCNEFVALPHEAAAAVLGRVLACVSGRSYPPGRGALGRLGRALLLDPECGGTLSGCRVSFHRGSLLVSREGPRGGRRPFETHLGPGTTVTWDHRFSVSLAPDDGDDLSLRRLGKDGWIALEGAKDTALPPVVRPTLPSVWCRGRPVHVPHLGYTASEMAHLAEKIRIRFAPVQPLTPIPFDLSSFRVKMPQ